MKLFIYSLDSMVESLKFGLVISNLSSSNSSSSPTTTRSNIIIITITIVYSFQWDSRQDHWCSSVEQIKTENVFQMASILKLKLKIKSDNQNNTKNYFFGPKYITSLKSKYTKSHKP